jgi:hypothetical protein
MAAIDDLLNQATADRSQVLVLRGAAGIGKIALLDYATRQAQAMRVLRCGGVESEIELAFAGLQQLIWPLTERLDRLPVSRRPRCAGRWAWAAPLVTGSSSGPPC